MERLALVPKPTRKNNILSQRNVNLPLISTNRIQNDDENDRFNKQKYIEKINEIKHTA